MPPEASVFVDQRLAAASTLVSASIFCSSEPYVKHIFAMSTTLFVPPQMNASPYRSVNSSSIILAGLMPSDFFHSCSASTRYSVS